MALADESSFLSLVEGSRDRRCREISTAADAQAREIVRAARRETGARVRHAVATHRDRLKSELAAARAELATRLRLVMQRAEQEWLERAWPRLLAALDQRWRAPDTRRAWIETLVARASSVLAPGSEWRIEHPAELDPAEITRLTRQIQPPPVLAPSPAISAGLRISAAGATLDGTVSGLLARRAPVEGRLLAMLEPEAP